jgi:hypothetical protein
MSHEERENVFAPVSDVYAEAVAASCRAQGSGVSTRSSGRPAWLAMGT